MAVASPRVRRLTTQRPARATGPEHSLGTVGSVPFESFLFDRIEIDGASYGHDLVTD